MSSSRRVRRAASLLVLALSASGFAVLPAATVAAQPSHTPSAECASDESPTARRPAGAADAHERNEVAQQDVAAIERDMRSRLGAHAGKPAAKETVPVVFHVVHAADGTGNVSNTAIRAQLAELNQDFAGQEAPGTAANTQFNFTLRAVHRWENDSWFNDPDSANGERALKTATHEGDSRTLNIWSTNTGYLGYATFPWWYADDPKLDGIVIQWGSLPGGPIDNYNEGKTATHESGHWLGLYHTFQGRCGNANDEVEDTPAMKTPTSGCPAGKDTCKAAGLDPIHNYMDYSYDSCYNQFTPGQATRMQDAWAAYRG
ncbi:zinc metalloprotease [Actinophytocola sp.]|uniref:zinc metalloprotease n=1 Tax=Actinophytocola sp. TaxID=1872138 RepID=UPI003D6B58DA